VTWIVHTDSLRHFLSGLKKDNYSAFFRDPQRLAEDLASNSFVDAMKNAEEEDCVERFWLGGQLVWFEGLEAGVFEDTCFLSFSAQSLPA
jgi:hypothetical protein